MCIHIGKEIDFKSLVYTILGASKSEICRGGWQARDLENGCCGLESEGLEMGFSLPWGTSVFSLKAFS